MPKVVCIVGYHNSGKTSLIERLIQELQRRGYKVGYIKHDPKGHGMTDKEGSDTDRIFKLSERVALMSPQKLTLWERREDDPLKVVVGDLEVEGFRVKGIDDLDRLVDFILE